MCEMLVTQKRNLGKQLVKQHLKTEKLYAALLENNHDAIFALDIEGHFLYGNSACESVSGYKLEELYELSFRQFLALEPGDIAQVEHHLTKALQGEMQEFSISILHKAGHPVRLYVRYFPIYLSGTLVGIFGIARELSCMIPKHEVTRESDGRYCIVTEHSSDIIAKFTVDGICTFVSPACRTMLGYEPAELLGRCLMQQIDYEDAKALSHLYFTLLTQTEAYSLTHRIRTKRGDYIWVETTAKSIRHPQTNCIQEILSISRDITYRKNAEDDLRNSEEQYRMLVDCSPDPIIICKNGNWIYSNAAGLKLLGASSREHMMGKSILEFIHPAYHRIVEEQLWEVKQGNEVDMIEQKLIRIDGEVIEVEVKAIFTYYQNQPAILMLVRDITEQKKTQELLQNSEKLTLVGQLAAGIAHEIRNPLTALKGFLQLMQTEGTAKQEYFTIMSSELARIELIVSELLVLAKPQSTYFQHRDLFTLIKHVVTLLDTEAILNQVQILTDFEADIPLINCDENQLKQAFINFLKNGIEAMPTGGEIHIKVSRESDRVLIHFTDQGCGIPEDKIPRLGEPFFTTKQAGTGLGLMVSNKIIQNHLGSVELTSKLGEGTTVTVTLPIQDGKATDYVL